MSRAIEPIFTARCRRSARLDPADAARLLQLVRYIDFSRRDGDRAAYLPLTHTSKVLRSAYLTIRRDLSLLAARGVVTPLIISISGQEVACIFTPGDLPEVSEWLYDEAHESLRRVFAIAPATSLCSPRSPRLRGEPAGVPA